MSKSNQITFCKQVGRNLNMTISGKNYTKTGDKEELTPIKELVAKYIKSKDFGSKSAQMLLKKITNSMNAKIEEKKKAKEEEKNKLRVEKKVVKHQIREETIKNKKAGVPKSKVSEKTLNKMKQLEEENKALKEKIESLKNKPEVKPETQNSGGSGRERYR